MATYETVFLGHDNDIVLVLSENGTAVDLSAATAMTLRVGRALITGTTHATSMLYWMGSTYAAGEVHIRLGGATVLHAGRYAAPLTVYDNLSTDGIVWGDILLDVRADVEAT